MKGLIEEGQEQAELEAPDPLKDAAIIGAAQRVEHYEIAAYGTLRQWALVLGETEAAELLDKTAREERHTDQMLTSIAERVNPHARAA